MHFILALLCSARISFQSPVSGLWRSFFCAVSSETGTSDFAEAVAVGLDALVRYLQKDSVPLDPKTQKRLILISDFANVPQNDPETLVESFTATMNHHKVHLEVVRVPRTGDDSKPLELSDRCEELLQLLCRQVDHNLHVYHHPADIQGLFPFKDPVRTTVLFRGTLDVGAHLKIAVKTANKVRRENFPPIGKESPIGFGGVTVSREYYRVGEQAAGADPVPDELRIRGTRYGKQYVPTDESFKARSEYHPDRTLQLVGFAQADTTPPHLFIGAPMVLVGDKDNEPSCDALAALVRAMHRRNRVAVLRMVARVGSSVKMYAGFPVAATTHARDHLVLNALPFQEDVRYNFEFHTFNKEGRAPSEAAVEAARDLVRAMLLPSPSHDATGMDACTTSAAAPGAQPTDTTGSTFKPEDTPNPTLHRFVNFFAERALADDSAVIPPEQDALLQRVAEVQANEMPGIEAVMEKVSLAMPTGGDAAKKRKPAQSLRSGQEEADFAEIMAQDDADKRTSAVSAFRKHIEALVDGSSGDYNFDKAAVRLAVLRRECVARGLAAAFNMHLDLLRGKYADDAIKGKFWTKVRESGILPISSEEIPGSAMTLKDARQYMVPASAPLA
jgi:hypothetical protein